MPGRDQDFTFSRAWGDGPHTPIAAPRYTEDIGKSFPRSWELLNYQLERYLILHAPEEHHFPVLITLFIGKISEKLVHFSAMRLAQREEIRKYLFATAD